MKNGFKNLFAVLGVLFVAVVVTAFMRPFLNQTVLNLYSQHSPTGPLPSYAIRLLPLIAVFALAGFTCTIIIDTAHRIAWAIFAIILSAILSPLFYSNSLMAPVPIHNEIEIYLPLAVPLLGMTFGALIGLCLKGDDHVIMRFPTKK